MKIGIDISQMVYEGTGVARYVEEMVRSLIVTDQQNQYILFGCSLRNNQKFVSFVQSFSPTDQTKIRLVTFPIPPAVLDFFWNMLHIIPIEWLIGSIDIFWSSDWTQPPLVHAKGVTTIHDLTIFRYPENAATLITAVHQRKLKRSKISCVAFFCDSEATKQDAKSMLRIEDKKLFTIYPGYQL